MKKFNRLSPDKRKEEIQEAAMELFASKGFAATSMENIIEKVSLSKGGVYRIYPSTSAILCDIIINGMRMRNAFYEEAVKAQIEQEKKITLEFLVEIIGDSLLLYPQISNVYVEFLWEKRRNPDLEKLYVEICRQSVEETKILIEKYGAKDLLLEGNKLEKLTEFMNGAILSINVLNLNEDFSATKEKLTKSVLNILNYSN